LEVNMESFVYRVADKVGIHARPAGKIVNAAKEFSAYIIIRKGSDGKEADAKRLFSVMSLAASCGEELTFIISGSDEAAAALAMKRLCEETL
jgi:phosphocarrier protein